MPPLECRDRLVRRSGRNPRMATPAGSQPTGAANKLRARPGLLDAAAPRAAAAPTRTRTTGYVRRHPDRRSGNRPFAFDAGSCNAGQPRPRTRDRVRLFDALDGPGAPAGRSYLDDRPGPGTDVGRTDLFRAHRRQRQDRDRQPAGARGARLVSAAQPRHRLHRCPQDRIRGLPGGGRPDAQALGSRGGGQPALGRGGRR